MGIWIALVGGILLGWVIEWVIDWTYWRRGVAGFYAKEDQLQRDLDAASAAHDDLAQSNNQLKADRDLLNQQLSALTADVDVLNQQVSELTADRDVLNQQLADALAVVKVAETPRRDDLEQIDGIGPVYEQKLFAAGITSYGQLAATPAEQLREIVQPAPWQYVDFEDWHVQARRFAEVVVADVLPYRLEEINGIGPSYAKRLNAAGIMTFSDLAAVSEDRLREIIPTKGLRLDYAGWLKQARAFVALTKGDRPPLPLERIKGIGPVFATRLDLAGIRSFEDLAHCNRETLQEIVGTRGVPSGEYAAWIEEAKSFLQQHTDTNGRGAANRVGSEA
jgi:predicted flap endonuclease-1-like 5' DNA nuclease